jgi:hypothetical protein
LLARCENIPVCDRLDLTDGLILNFTIMARYTKGALGAFSGKLGNVVGANWRHIDYLRSLPRPSKKPASLLQLAQRAKFGMVVSFLATIKDVLNIGFGDAKRGRSTGFNQAVKIALQEAVMGDYPDFEIDYGNVTLSVGSLAGLVSLEFVEESPMNIELTWEAITNSFNSFEDDDVVILFYNKTKKLFSIYEDSQRRDQSFSTAMPNSFEGDELVSWVFLVNRDGETTSPSQFAGELVLEG